MTDRFVLVINPRAGAGKAGRRVNALEAALSRHGASFETRLTEAPGDATRLCREAIEAGRAGVAVVGGDGTLNEAVNGFVDAEGRALETDTWLGVLPCGTGGDFRKTLGLGKDVESSVDRLMRSDPRPVDLGYLRFVNHAGAEEGRAFINISSFGVSGLVDQLVNAGPKWIGGTPAFLLGTVRALVRYREPVVRVRVDGDVAFEGPITNIAVANGRYFGSGMEIAPKAAIDDGLFDVVTLEARPTWTQLRRTPHLYRGTVLEQAGVRWVRGTEVHAEAVDDATEVLLDVDGEQPGRLPATFHIHAGALRLRG